jgi:hypothetical protein
MLKNKRAILGECQKSGTGSLLLDRFGTTLFNQNILVSSLNQSGLLIFVCYFLAIFAFSLAKRKALPGKTLYLLRALLPSWRFFENFDEAPALYFRCGSGSGEMGEWEKCLKRPHRRVLGLLYNPEANYVLAAGSVVQQLLSEVNDLTETETDADAVEQLVSYQLTKNLVRFHLPESSASYQFKVSGISEDILISPVYEKEISLQ